MATHKIERIEGVEKIAVVSDKLIITKLNPNKNIIIPMVSFEFLVLNSWRLSIFPSSIIIFSFLPPRGYFTWLLHSHTNTLGYLSIG